jgi:hypothetical protein
MTDEEISEMERRGMNPLLTPLTPEQRLNSAQAELEAKASTSERTKVREPDASGTLLSIKEATARYSVSDRTLRRRLDAGEIPGAHRVPSTKGELWQIPVASLESLGFKRLETTEQSEALPEAPETKALLELISELTNQLALERRQLTEGREIEAQKAEKLTEKATALAIENATLKATLDAERERRAHAEKRWWRRSKNAEQ